MKYYKRVTFELMVYYHYEHIAWLSGKHVKTVGRWAGKLGLNYTGEKVRKEHLGLLIDKLYEQENRCRSLHHRTKRKESDFRVATQRKS